MPPPSESAAPEGRPAAVPGQAPSPTISAAASARSAAADSAAPVVQAVAAAGTSFAIVTHGAGTPMVFVHGAGGDWRTWEPLRAFIAPHHQFVSYSRRYHYPNDTLGGGRDYTVPAHADDLIAIVLALGAGPVHVVGGSYGARVVLDAAVRRPELFLTVVASEAFITPPTDAASQVAAQVLAEALGRIAVPLRQGDTAGATVELVKAVTGRADGWKRLDPEARQRFLDNQASWVPLASAPQVPDTPCDALRTLPMPVLVMEGEHTVPGFRVTNDRLMQCLPPTARRAVVPGAPHMWYPVNPSAASRLILDFVAEASR